MGEHSIGDAARALGISADTVRRRIRRGELVARRAEVGRWLVTLPDDAVTTPTASDALARVLAELDAKRALLAEVTRQRDDLAGIVAAQQRQLDDAATERHEMRMLLAQAQASIGRLLPAPMQTSPTSRPWWRFWR